jgi:hypothetical protein
MYRCVSVISQKVFLVRRKDGFAALLVLFRLDVVLDGFILQDSGRMW